MRALVDTLVPLMQKYRDIFAESWRSRRDLDPPSRNADELAFLPSAMSLRDTPLHPAPRFLMWGIVVMFVLALGWSFVGQIDVVATGRGKVVPGSGSRPIQASELAVVRAVHVKNGQHVGKGEALVDFDNSIARADVQRIRAQLAIRRIDRAIAASMLGAVAEIAPPQAVRGELTGLPEQDIRQAETRLTGRYRAFETELEEKSAELRQLDTQYAAAKAAVRGLAELVPLSREVSSSMKTLSNKAFVARSQYLDKEQLRLTQENNLETQRFEVRKIEAARSLARRQRENLLSRWRQEMLDMQTGADGEMRLLEQDLAKALRRNALMSLTSPVDGTVQQVSVQAEGGVVTEAQALMIVVPDDDPIEIEAMLPNKDVAFVRPGLPVEAKIDAFEFTKYGLVGGTISTLSTDAIEMEGAGPVYAMRILVKDVPAAITLSPGMSVTTEVKIGSRRIIDYFLSPLNVYLHDSLRER